MRRASRRAEAQECGSGFTMLIKAQKLVTRGKLAETEGEDGVITLTSTVAADDTANMGGDNTNIQSTAETAQEFITYAGCHANAGKSYHRGL
jgi:hypothetical protein